MFTRTSSLALVALAVLAGTACDSELREQSELQPAPQVSSPDAGTASLVQQMIAAPSTTLLRGVRRFEAHWQLAGEEQTLIYREQVTCNGQGLFAVDPLETIDPALGGGPQSLFFLLQKQREGFMFTHRDFMVRDQDLFFGNYQVLDLGVTTTVVGRECAQLDVQLQQGAKTVHHLAVDLETGMVLRAREEALDGALLSLVEFESLDMMPDLSGQVFHQPLTQEVQLGKQNKPLPFLAVQPKLIPEGYQLLSSTVLEDAPASQSGTQDWVRYTYSDGLRELFFLYSGEPDLVKPVGASPVGGPPGPALPRTDSVTVLSVGPWNVVQGHVFDGDVIVMGMASQTQLLDMIESAFN